MSDDVNEQAKKNRIKRRASTHLGVDWARLDLELKERPALSINELRQEALSLAVTGRLLGQGARSSAKARGEVASNARFRGRHPPPKNV